MSLDWDSPRRNSGIIGLGILSIVVVIAYATDRCYVQEHLGVIVLLGCGWLVAFIFTPYIAKIVLILVAFVVVLAQNRPEFTSNVEAGAVGTLLKTAAAVGQYQHSHPTEGYPASVPIQPNCRTRGLYAFTYRSYRSAGGSIVDKFALEAVPLKDTHQFRSFTLTEEGKVHATNSPVPRAATRDDPVLQ